jgi:hypothetical protein
VVKETDSLRAASPPVEPRRGSTIEMVDRIREQNKIEPKEPPRGR